MTVERRKLLRYSNREVVIALVYSHASGVIGADMRFGLYLPPQAQRDKVPALYYLAGLTCSEETFMIKAGALRLAAEYGLALVACDTSPRGLNLPGDSASWDFGVGAGFYLDASAAPWSTNYRMGSYVNLELPELVEAHFPVRTDRRGIFGHSMGGHGALVTAIPRAGIRCRRLHRSPIRWPRRGAGRRSATIWAPTRRAGRSGMRAYSCARAPTRITSWWTRGAPISSCSSSCIQKHSKPRPGHQDRR